MKEENCKTTMTSSVFGSEEMLKSAPVDKLPQHPTTPEIAYRMVKDETFAQTQPRLNMATFVTTYMDKHATKLMNEAIALNYIDETEYPRETWPLLEVCYRELGNFQKAYEYACRQR